LTVTLPELWLADFDPAAWIRAASRVCPSSFTLPVIQPETLVDDDVRFIEP